MLKLAIGFVAFAALSLFVIFKSGGSIDMGGEKHGVDAHPPATEAPAATPGGEKPADKKQ